jgi:hypothetical protein
MEFLQSGARLVCAYWSFHKNRTLPISLKFVFDPHQLIFEYEIKKSRRNRD